MVSLKSNCRHVARRAFKLTMKGASSASDSSVRVTSRVATVLELNWMVKSALPPGAMWVGTGART